MTRVADLAGAELALWVARAIGMKFVMRGEWPAEEFDFDPERHATEHLLGSVMKQYVYFRPHEDWSQGGPIIEREGGSLFRCNEEAPFWIASWWFEEDGRGRPLQYKGPTALIAAMRAFVASKFGENVTDQEAPCVQ